MSNERTRDRGNLFENTQKKKPSQPDFQGDCTIEMTAYEIRGWRREDQLTVSLAPPRGDQNTYPPDVFRGALEAVPKKPVRANPRASKDVEIVATPSWIGDIVSEEAAYKIRAFEKQGKSGMYYTLTFERIAMPTDDEPADEAPGDESAE